MLIYVTSRKLCRDDFFQRINHLAKGKPSAIMLREKDLDLSEYEALAIKVKELCRAHHVPLIINQNFSVAEKLELPNIHFSMDNLRKYKSELRPFIVVGASVHSVAEAEEAFKLGATYLIAGHVFSTDCKKGVPPRGLPFLKKICDLVPIPVFAIGGITKDKVTDIKMTGAKGVCIMSEAMTCRNPVVLANEFRR
ncbi:MAG TPA: thiamine phosphate synthase [Bacillus bacterium]|nr:thiamine phosphate synthase [Bacillus sp. (in: firmicutes)]